MADAKKKKQPPDEGEKWKVKIPREMIRVCYFTNKISDIG
jgi:hypothetical protein